MLPRVTTPTWAIGRFARAKNKPRFPSADHFDSHQLQLASPSGNLTSLGLLIWARIPHRGPLTLLPFATIDGSVPLKRPGEE
jgi:hypothetical protein